MNARTELNDSRQRLATDVRAVMNDAEALLRAAKDEAGLGVAEARGRLEQSLAAAKDAVIAMERAALDRANAAKRATDDYVHANPWTAIGAGAAIGAILGALLARR